MVGQSRYYKWLDRERASPSCASTANVNITFKYEQKELRATSICHIVSLWNHKKNIINNKKTKFNETTSENWERLAKTLRGMHTSDKSLYNLRCGFHFTDGDLNLAARLDFQLTSECAPSLSQIGRLRVLVKSLWIVQTSRFLNFRVFFHKKIERVVLSQWQGQSREVRKISVPPLSRIRTEHVTWELPDLYSSALPIEWISIFYTHISWSYIRYIFVSLSSFKFSNQFLYLCLSFRMGSKH